MLQRFPSLLDVSRSLAGRMRDEADAQLWHQCPLPVRFSVVEAKGTLEEAERRRSGGLGCCSTGGSCGLRRSRAACPTQLSRTCPLRRTGVAATAELTDRGHEDRPRGTMQGGMHELAGQLTTSRPARTWSTPAVSTSSERWVAGGAWRLCAAAALARNGAWLCTRCTFRSTTSSTLAVFGEGAEWTGWTESAATGEIGAAVRSNRTTTNPARREPRP